MPFNQNQITEQAKFIYTYRTFGRDIYNGENTLEKVGKD